MFELYDKLNPKDSEKSDVKYYKKCYWLDFVEPENLIKCKRMINGKLWKTSMALIKGMDAKLTTQDKVKNLGKDLIFRFCTNLFKDMILFYDKRKIYETFFLCSKWRIEW